MMSKTTPNQAELDMTDGDYRQRLKNWAHPSAERFGTWHDWTREDIDYLLEELRAGFMSDIERDRSFGWVVSAAGIEVAQVAEREYGEPAIAGMLSALREGLMLAMEDADSCENADEAFERAERILSIIDEDPDVVYRSERISRPQVLQQ
jgi:hypothetical protein